MKVVIIIPEINTFFQGFITELSVFDFSLGLVLKYQIKLSNFNISDSMGGWFVQAANDLQR